MNYQEAFLSLPENEQIILRNLHKEEAIKEDAVRYIEGLQKHIQKIVDTLTGTKWEKTHQQVSNFLLLKIESKLSEKDILDLNINHLNIGTRALNSLKAENIYFIGEVIQKTENDLLHMPGVDRRSLNKINEALTVYGLSLGMGSSNWTRPIR